MYLTRILITIIILSVVIIGCGSNSDDKVSDAQNIIEEQNPSNPEPETKPDGLAMDFAPLKLETSKNNVFSAEISINNVKDLYGCYFDLNYDPKLLEAVEGSKGDFLGDDILSLFHIESGIMSAGMTRKSKVEGVNGSGVVAHVKFKALAPGIAEVKIVLKNDLALRTSEGKSIEGIDEIVIKNLEVQIK